MSSPASIESPDYISIIYSEVPLFLHCSAFYKGLSVEENHSMLLIPVKCFKVDDSVYGLDDLNLLLHTMIFWGLDVIPDSVLDFCYDNDFHLWKGVTDAVPDNNGLDNLLTSYIYGSEGIKPAVTSENFKIRRLIWSSRSESLDEPGEVVTTNTPDNRNYTRKTDNIMSAVETGHPEIIQHWLRRNPPVSLEEPSHPCAFVAGVGNLEILKQLHEHNYILDAGVCSSAAWGGHLACLVYLHENFCPLDGRSTTGAAAGGYLECLQYLHERGCPWDHERWNQGEVCFRAASNGHLSCLRFAHENGAELTARVTLTKHIDCLRYALQQNCPIYEYIQSGALIAHMTLSMLELLEEHGIVWGENVCRNSAQCGSSPDILRHFIERGYQYDRNILNATVWDSDKPEHLKYLVEETLLEMNEKLYSEAVINGSVGCVQFLVDSGCPCTFVWHLNLDSHEMPDENVLTCIQYATERGWACSNDLIDLVFSEDLPMCQAYLRDEGWAEITRVYSYKGRKSDPNKAFIRRILVG